MEQKSSSKIAVVGAGLIGRKHIDVVSEFAQLQAIIDPDPKTAELARARGATWHKSQDTFLNAHKPDGVIIATPNQLHLEHGSACIAAGLPVLIEKPLAENAASARELAEHSHATGVPVLVGHHRRHSPVIKTAKAAIDDGLLGRIVTVNAQFWLYKPDDYFDVAWRRSEGAGPTFINLIHDIDLLRHFCGDVRAVQARESNAVRGFDVEDSSAVILEFENGILGTVSISDTVVAPWSWELTAGENPAYPKTDMSCYMIGGTEGSLSVPDLNLWRHTRKRSWWAPIAAERLTYEPADPVKEQFLHFLNIIEQGTTPLVPAREGMKNLQVLDAIKAAARHGGIQALDAGSVQSAAEANT